MGQDATEPPPPPQSSLQPAASGTPAPAQQTSALTDVAAVHSEGHQPPLSDSQSRRSIGSHSLARAFAQPAAETSLTLDEGQGLLELSSPPPAALAFMHGSALHGSVSAPISPNTPKRFSPRVLSPSQRTCSVPEQVSVPNTTKQFSSRCCKLHLKISVKVYTVHTV